MTTLALILAGLILLWLGAEFLVRGSCGLARRLGVTPLIIGLTVVAFGTSAPEFVVSLQAALSGLGDVSVGNVIGSNIANVSLVLGFAALLSPIKVQKQLLRSDLPFMIVATLVFCFFLRDGNLGRLECGALFAAFLLYVVKSIRDAIKEKNRRGNTDAAQETVDKKSWLEKSYPWQAVFIVAGLALLVLGSKLLVDGAVTLAAKIGVTEAVIAITVVAVGTSLPELAASAMAAIKKESDLSIGNVVGSCIFNMLGIIGACGLIRPMRTDGISSMDLFVMAAVSLLILPMCWTNRVLSRLEGAALLLVYVGYTVALFVR